MGRGFSHRLIVMCAALLIGGCGELTPPGERGSGFNSTINPDASPNTYTVRSSDTLYSIAWAYGLDHRELAALNNIPPPYTIYPGQRLVTVAPQAAVRSAISSSSSTKKETVKKPKKSAQPSLSRSTPRHSKTPKPSAKKSNSPSDSSPALEKKVIPPKSLVSKWRWPTEGRVIAGYDAPSGKKGIDISGRSGQMIFSAAPGYVVYSGSGLLGYGNIVIIKHDDIYLSAYGHNSQLLVKEGDKVDAGQQIAKMGVSPKEGAILHFEIRKEGKPVDPAKYLPKKN